MFLVLGVWVVWPAGGWVHQITPSPRSPRIGIRGWAHGTPPQWSGRLSLGSRCLAFSFELAWTAWGPARFIAEPCRAVAGPQASAEPQRGGLVCDGCGNRWSVLNISTTSSVTSKSDRKGA